MEHIAQGPKILYEMRLVIEVIIIKIGSNPLLQTKYRNRFCNIRELADIFQDVNDFFSLANQKRRFDQFGQLSWQTFIWDAC